MAVVLSGLSGAFYYKPAGTVATFFPSDVDTGNALLQVGSGFNFRPGDSVRFRIVNTLTGLPGTGILPGGIEDSSTYYVISYNNSTGLLAISVNATLTPIITLTNTGSLATPNKFQIFYAAYGLIAEVRDWTLEISRAEIDVTRIGKALDQYVPFRNYISGFGDATGSTNVYITDEDQGFANRMVQDVLLRKQVGASVKLYIERVESGGSVDEIKSRSIEMEVALTSASLNINPDDGQSVAINFRPSNSISFDFSAPPPPPPDVTLPYWSEWQSLGIDQPLMF